MQDWRTAFIRLCWLAALVMTLLLPSTALSWGQIGHRVVAQIAEDHLTDEARAVAESILLGRSLAQAATWPDEIRNDDSWGCASPFHYVTLPAKLRDEYPSQAVEDGDALQALIYFTDVLRQADADAKDRLVALRFVIHIVGDIHQPLHNGLGCDRGANRVKVKWFDDGTNLHTVWDEKLVEAEHLSFSEFSSFLDHADDAEPFFNDETTPLDWIRSSQTLLPAAYGCEAGNECDCKMGMELCGTELKQLLVCEEPTPADASTRVPNLKYVYSGDNVPVIRNQLLAGGIHLAKQLNWALDASAKPPAKYRELAQRVRSLADWDHAASTCHRSMGP